MCMAEDPTTGTHTQHTAWLLADRHRRRLWSHRWCRSSSLELACFQQRCRGRPRWVWQSSSCRSQTRASRRSSPTRSPRCRGTNCHLAAWCLERPRSHPCRPECIPYMLCCVRTVPERRTTCCFVLSYVLHVAHHHQAVVCGVRNISLCEREVQCTTAYRLLYCTVELSLPRLRGRDLQASQKPFTRRAGPLKAMHNLVH